MRPHLPPGAGIPAAPRAVRPLLLEVGEAAGHRLLLLSIEDWGAWADIRFSRLSNPGAPPLARRIPLATDWEVTIDGIAAEVVDVAGRGDRGFSNGEIRIRPAPEPGATLGLRALLAPGAAVTTTLFVPQD
jgi:hypothetical protein